MLKRKDTIICLKVRLIKKTEYKKTEYFPKQKSLGVNFKVELDLSKHAIKEECYRYIRFC